MLDLPEDPVFNDDPFIKVDELSWELMAIERLAALLLTGGAGMKAE
tara:strand:- start:437 stop:574 length:138 start_codon:yes stop_codon:yes gene_type:complete